MQRQRHNTKELHCCSQFMQSTSRLPADPSDRQRNSQPKYNPVLLQSHISRMGLIWQEVASIREGTYAKKYAECFLRYMRKKWWKKVLLASISLFLPLQHSAMWCQTSQKNKGLMGHVSWNCGRQNHKFKCRNFTLQRIKGQNLGIKISAWLKLPLHIFMSHKSLK